MFRIIEKLNLNFFESPWGSEKPEPKKPNDFSDFFTQGKNKFPKFLQDGRNGGGKFILTAFLLLAGIWFASGLYNVEEGEQAVILRFGKLARQATPGLNYHIPEPFEQVIKQKVERIESEEIGFRSSGIVEGSYLPVNTQRNVTEESLMLTGDENLVDVNFIFQWKINNIQDYIFNLYRSKETIKSSAESAMREVIGNTPIAIAQTEGRSIVEQKVKALLQDILNHYKSGVEVVNVRLLKVDPPAEVIDAFRDVQTARADKEREINQAQAYQNDIIPRARGESSKILQESEAYKQEIVATALGEVSRFNALYKQYKTAPQLTRKRLYIEAMEEILSNIDKTIIDSPLDKNILPHFSIKTLNQVEKQ